MELQSQSQEPTSFLKWHVPNTNNNHYFQRSFGHHSGVPPVLQYLRFVIILRISSVREG